MRIARLILSDPTAVAVRTAAGSAALAKVHPSSMIRFARAFGYPGYRGLVAVCQAHLADRARLVGRFQQGAAASSSVGAASAALGGERPARADYMDAFDSDSRNLAATFAGIDPAAWRRAVEILSTAEHVHVIGLRKCLAVAELLAYLLHIVRANVHLVAPVQAGLADCVRDMRPGHALVAVSLWRYTWDTVRAVAHAQDRGVRVIALTDSAVSPLAAKAEATICVEGESPFVLRSLTSAVAVAQALVASLARRGGRDVIATLEQDDAVLSEFGTYAEDTLP
jgi:DNA-binding MurR/RpiR family transcriptional regulator